MARKMPEFPCLVVAVALALLSLSAHVHESTGDSPIPGACVACAIHHSPGVAAEATPAVVEAPPAGDARPAPWVGLRPFRGARSGLFERGPPAA